VFVNVARIRSEAMRNEGEVLGTADAPSRYSRF
jgi:hypothetical protein